MRSVVILASAAVALAFGGATAAAQTQPADSAVAAAPTAAAAHADSSHTASSTRRPRRNMSQLTSAELDSAHVSSTYDAVARLRPRWLRTVRSGDLGGAAIEIQVYRSTGQSLGNLESLKQVVPGTVELLQWLDPVVARGRFGPRAENGAIVITDKT
jgi:hypothetical protein